MRARRANRTTPAEKEAEEKRLMETRLQKIIATTGLASRRKAEMLIASGRVTVNGKVVTELGTKVDPERDHVKVDGKHIENAQPCRSGCFR
jgi:16S rRNA U516 pseudouridylate synthase RsuA-like enzyme